MVPKIQKPLMRKQAVIKKELKITHDSFKKNKQNDLNSSDQFKKYGLSYISKQRKAGSINYKTLSNSGYVVYYYITDKNTLDITLLHNKERATIPQLKNIYYKILKVAKENNVDYISTVTWIFAEHPKLAEELGFELVPSSDFVYKRMLKKYNIKKIIGFDAVHSSVKAKTNSGKIINVYLPSFPEYVLKIK